MRENWSELKFFLSQNVQISIKTVLQRYLGVDFKFFVSNLAMHNPAFDSLAQNT